MKKLLNNKALFKYLFWIWMITLVILSCIPDIPTQKINIWEEPFRLDYLEHFLVFGALMGFYIIWKSNENGTFTKNEHLKSLGFLILFAVVDEGIQLWVPGRTFNPLDLLSNISGLIIFFVISPLVIKQFYKN